jgi:topoisomerase-4 subunit B
MSRNGLLDLLEDNMNSTGRLYEPIHLKGDDIELAICHGDENREEYYSFANGQFTPQGGTHQQAFREAYVKTIREFFKKDYDASDIRSSIIAAISIKLHEPTFESQTKIKLGSKEMAPGSELTVNKFVGDFVKRELDNYLHRHGETADIIRKKIEESEKERKAISSIRKSAKEFARKASLHNDKLRDCRVHYTDEKHEKFLETTLFMTEGNSASGSITKSRNVNTQAVFSLRGKPLNTFGMTNKVVYINKEFNLLQAALDIEEDIENLRYNRVVIATDADVDGMHIRLLLITFFLQFFPDLIRKGHLYILQTPLFRVRNKKDTYYCYSEEEKAKALKKLGSTAEITRFKGLGEISPHEFAGFIGDNIRLDPVNLSKTDTIQELLTFYMGKNTPDRQNFIIGNLRIEEDIENN